MGIDPGSNKVGWGVLDRVEHHDVRYVGSGVLQLGRSLLFEDKLRFLYQEISALMVKYRPDRCAIEKVFLNINPGSTITLCQFRGAILVAIALHIKSKIMEYAPNTIKKAVVGRGKAQKEQIRFMLGHIFPESAIASEDEADALAVALCCAYDLNAVIVP